jgi:hypothetical protein
MRKAKDKFLGYIDEWADKPKDERTFLDHATDLIVWAILVIGIFAVWWLRHAAPAGLWPFN